MNDNLNTKKTNPWFYVPDFLNMTSPNHDYFGQQWSGISTHGQHLTTRHNQNRPIEVKWPWEEEQSVVVLSIYNKKPFDSCVHKVMI